MYKKKHIHFIGIGGIGMSGIATILQKEGYTVSGCDNDHEQQSIQNLKRIDCAIFQGNNSTECYDPSIDVLVYSTAIAKNNPEVVAAQKRAIPVVHRSIMLAEIMKNKQSIAVAGSHGKTTTSALISHILITAEKDPTILIGGHLNSINSNARYGLSNLLVAEADESDRSLLNLQPTCAVLTNVDLEHLETYTDLEDVKKTFTTFLNKLPSDGIAFVCADDTNIKTILPRIKNNVVSFGIDDSNANIHATDIVFGKNSTTCTIKKNNTRLGTITFAMAGKHNLLNALAAITTTLELGVPFEIIAQALATFYGVDRRFTFKGTYQGADVFDDYGHHPKEILHTLSVARGKTDKKLIVIFQPHRYTRTKEFWHEFVNVFAMENMIDQFIITDVYAASEQPIAAVSSQDLTAAISTKNNVIKTDYIPWDDTFSTMQKLLSRSASEGDLVLLLGAGKVNRIVSQLFENQ